MSDEIKHSHSPRGILATLRPGTARLFRAKLHKTGRCLEFTGHRNPRGYGIVEVSYNYGERRYPILAHRLAWALAHGEDPPPDKLVLHRNNCNNPPCCNVDHLYIGTAADNVRDMIAAGRAKFGAGKTKPWLGKSGEQHPRSRYSDEQRAAVLRLYGEGVLWTEIARRTGCPLAAIKEWPRRAGLPSRKIKKRKLKPRLTTIP